MVMMLILSYPGDERNHHLTQGEASASPFLGQKYRAFTLLGIVEPKIVRP